MSGLLSNMFGDDEGQDAQSSQEAQSYDASGDAGLDLSPTVNLGHEASGSYENLDGSTTEWSSDTDITATVDVSAALGAVAAYETESDAN
ncbi:hypothetical protein RZN05_11790 [Sphingomonas sp. HF-S4]|uniref:Uncharacterized protein n=1 Tax=Sphingomonas agrestis TaxID=3080540 RepID=A0ABU3Y8G5_9SPHN|nr:hypothetical protein [Sphingomonas sp. HF-S4]MDV3457669.1 hypothetical protein [Sphingomonas sp. HF-S4]